MTKNTNRLCPACESKTREKDAFCARCGTSLKPRTAAEKGSTSYNRDMYQIADPAEREIAMRQQQRGGITTVAKSAGPHAPSDLLVGLMRGLQDADPTVRQASEIALKCYGYEVGTAPSPAALKRDALMEADPEKRELILKSMGKA